MASVRKRTTRKKSTKKVVKVQVPRWARTIARYKKSSGFPAHYRKMKGVKFVQRNPSWTKKIKSDRKKLSAKKAIWRKKCSSKGMKLQQRLGKFKCVSK